MTINMFKPLFGLLIAIAFTATCHAESKLLESKQGKRPERLTAVVGDVLIRIDGPKMWTLSGMDFQKTVLAVEDSAYGTVLNLRGIGALGTAHFLDVPGKPGEVEKENVTGVEFFVDDRPVAEITPRMQVTGKSFRMERRSKIRMVDVESQVSLRDGVLLETARLRSELAVDLKGAFPLMYAWTPTATRYVFGNDQGIQKRGEFVRAPGKTVEGSEKTSRWMGVFDGPSGKGAVCYFSRLPANVESVLQYTDAPNVYRKLRLMTFVEMPMPAGFDGTYQSAIGFFTATEANWEATALRRLAEIKAVAVARSRE